jgi:hypothetical protein
MKLNILKAGILFFLLISCMISFAQESKQVEARGFGIQRDDAIQDALRAAISQAVGVSLASETEVENFMIVKDAISSNTSGYIESYDIVDEVKSLDGFEITVSANVSLSPVKADAKLLMKQIGGVRFLAMYDQRKVDKDQQKNYDYIIEKVNGFLAQKQYRYIEKTRLQGLLDESIRIMKDTDTNSMTFVQKLGLMSGAQFIILVDNIHIKTRSEAFDTRTAKKVIIEAKAYDNCTAEGLGTIMLESNWNSSGDLLPAIDEAINNSFPELLQLFTAYIGNWVNNGTPYELRFYQTGTFRDFRDLRNKIKESSDYGGQLEITGMNDFTKLNVTFTNLPDNVAFMILDFADEIPGFKEKVLDVLLIYGRQISFAPQHVVIPGLEEEKKIMNQN